MFEDVFGTKFINLTSGFFPYFAGVTNGIKGSGNPYIDPELSTNNQTVVVGKQIILRCHIEDSANKSVSSKFAETILVAEQNKRYEM